MFMRYYPKQIKPIPRLVISPTDRGRRHYWNSQRRDYGLCQSQDQSYRNPNVKEENDRSNPQERSIRGYSTNINNCITGYKIKQKDDNLLINRSQKIIQNLKRKKTLRIAHPIELHLPSIRKITKQTQTMTEVTPQLPNSFHLQQKYRNQVKSKNKINTTNSDVKFKNKMKRHLMSGEADELYRQNFSINNRLNPTFVCSIQNPLPTYIISPHVYRSLAYSRCFSRND